MSAKQSIIHPTIRYFLETIGEMGLIYEEEKRDEKNRVIERSFIIPFQSDIEWNCPSIFITNLQEALQDDLKTEEKLPFDVSVLLELTFRGLKITYIFHRRE